MAAQHPLTCLLLLLLSSSHGWNSTDQPRTFYIGGVLSSETTAHAFTMEAQSIDYKKMYFPPNVTLYDSTQIMDSNPIKTAIVVCNKLIKEQVYAIIVSKPEKGELSPASVSYTAGFYHIPVIGISSRDSAFSDKNIHVSFLRTVPPYSHQADVWVELLKHFQYKQLVFLHSSDTDGRSLLGRFQTRTQELEAADDQEVKVERVEEFEPGRSSYREVVQGLRDSQARVYFLYATKKDAEVIFEAAEAENMTGAGYAWIVTEQALKSENIPHGALGLALTSAEDEEAHIHDSLHILAKALAKLYREEEDVEEAPSSCNSSGSIWETGKKLFNYIREQTFRGRTGLVAFDSMGDRLFAEYKVVNMQREPGTREARRLTVGSYAFSSLQGGLEEGKMVLEVEDSDIVWPGGSSKKPEGVMIPTHLKVLTVQERPFTYTKKRNYTERCGEGWVDCPKYVFNSSNGAQQMGAHYCCQGYCMDLLEKLAQTCNFTYDLYYAESEYGSLETNNETGKPAWTGLIGELVVQHADLIIAPLTINPERAQVMEFSKPFKYQGITILQKREPHRSTLVSFLQPFKYTLWILVLVSVKVIAICLYLLDRFSPFGRYNTEPREEEESLSLTSAIWFAWGVLLNSGIGEGTPRSFSARVLGMVWAGFAMIIVASYTANLAAFLVLDKPQTSLTGINDPRLRNPMENFTYATVRGSSVDMYFRRQVELSNMYRTMEGKSYPDPEIAISAVKNNTLKAFIWDSSRLEYEAARDCDLVTAGELFGRSGYGVGLQKGSPWADRVTLAILDYHESGFMESLDNKWILIKIKNCGEKDGNNPVTLGLDSMRGVFILVGLGIVGGVVLIVVEIVYHKHKVRRDQKNAAAKEAILRWKGTIESDSGPGVKPLACLYRKVMGRATQENGHSKRKTVRTVREASGLQKRFGSRANGISGGDTAETLALSVESLPSGRRQYRSEVQLARPQIPRPKSTLTLQSPHSLHRLPSAEFLRMLGTDQQLESPLTSLSFDFGGERSRGTARPASPDLLRRSSPDLVSAGRPDRRPREGGGLCRPVGGQCGLQADRRDGSEGSSGLGSPDGQDYSTSDYAPVSTEHWVGAGLPRPPPPPRQRPQARPPGYTGTSGHILL